MTRSHHSGPLSSIPALKAYNELVPNGVDRVMRIAEHQSEYWKQLDKMGVRSSFNQSSIGR